MLGAGEAARCLVGHPQPVERVVVGVRDVRAPRHRVDRFLDEVEQVAVAAGRADARDTQVADVAEEPEQQKVQGVSAKFYASLGLYN